MKYGLFEIKSQFFSHFLPKLTEDLNFRVLERKVRAQKWSFPPKMLKFKNVSSKKIIIFHRNRPLYACKWEFRNENLYFRA